MSSCFHAFLLCQPAMLRQNGGFRVHNKNKGVGVATTVTKAELADLLSDSSGLSKQESKEIVQGFFDQIRVALELGDCVKLSGFGNFQLRDKPQRPGRNPKTGVTVPISARRVVTFHASQKLRVAVAGGSGS